MTQTISWMVQREPSGEQARVTRLVLTWFLAGGLIGGSIAGVVIVGLARIILILLGGEMRVFAAGALVTSVMYLGPPLRLWRMPKPQIRQQVPPSWRDVWPPRMAAFLYAGALGFGFVTRISSLALLPLIILTLGFGRSPLTILALFALVGFVRSATALVVPLFGWVDVDSSVIVNTLGSGSNVAKRLEGVVLGIAAALLLTGVVA